MAAKLHIAEMAAASMTTKHVQEISDVRAEISQVGFMKRNSMRKPLHLCNLLTI